MPGKYDTVQLAKDIKENKTDALDRLLDIYGSAILGFIRSKNLINDMDSEDIYQDTVINIWKGIGAYNPDKGTFLGFLMSFANDSIDAYYKTAASDGDKDDGYMYDDYLEPEESLVHEENSSPAGESLEAVELVQELKGKPDFLVINSSYLFEKYVLLFKTLMGEVIPVHYALIYAVIKLAASPTENVKGLEIDDLMDKTLFELLLIFKREYSQYSAIPDANIDDEIMLMFNRLDEMTDGRKLGLMKLEELIAIDEESDLSNFNTIVNGKIREYIDGKFLEIFKV